MNTIYCISPQQRIMRTERSEQSQQGIITADYIKKAVTTLSTAGLKLYCCLCSRMTEGEFIANSTFAHDLCGMSRSVYTTAYSELTKKGYIVQDKKHPQFYVFYPAGK